MFTEWPWILEACAAEDPEAVIGAAQQRATADMRIDAA